MSVQITKRELLSKHALSAGLGVGALVLMPPGAGRRAELSAEGLSQ